VDALVLLWNELRTPGPKVRQVGGELRQKLQRAMKTLPNLDDWRTVIVFLNGQGWANAPGTGTHPNWRAGLDWLAKPGKCAEYLERAQLDQAQRKTDGGLVGRDAARGRTGVDRDKYADVGRAAL
jgi:hypothetical protein